MAMHVWPHSPALEVAPRYSVPWAKIAAPPPLLHKITTACWVPRPAPSHISACPSAFAPFSTNTGTPTRFRISPSSGTSFQCFSHVLIYNLN